MDLKHIIANQRRRKLGAALDIDFLNYNLGQSQVGPAFTHTRSSSGTFVNQNGLIVGKTKTTTTLNLFRLVLNVSQITIDVPSGSVIGWLQGSTVILMQDLTGNDIHTDSGDGFWIQATILHVSDTKLTLRVINRSGVGSDTLISNWWVSYRGIKRAHDPITLRPLGFLSERTRTNRYARSSDFSDVSWSKNNLAVDTVNFFTAPDGTLTGTKLIENNASNTHTLGNGVTPAATVHTLSVFAKKGERNWISLRFGGLNSFFNLETGTATANAYHNPTITPYANGWYRCAVTSSLGTQGSIWMSLDGTNNPYQGDGTSGVYIWGAQMENGKYATSYIPTTALAAIRSGDVYKMPALALTPNFTIDTEVIIRQAEGANTTAMFIAEVYKVWGFRAGYSPVNKNIIFWSGESVPDGGPFGFGAYTPTNSITLDVPTRITFTLEGVSNTICTAKIYINGTLQATATGLYIAPPTPASVNVNTENLNATDHNNIYQSIRFYNRALSDEEISYSQEDLVFDDAIWYENDQLTITTT